MIVSDASAVVELLLGRAEALQQSLQDGEQLAAPHLIDAEVGQALRRFVHAGWLHAAPAGDALADLGLLPLTRYPHGELLGRAFALRDNVTVSDGLYLALAELLDRPLLTGDRALVSVPGCHADVRLLAAV